MATVKIQNWKRTITYYASAKVEVHSVDDIVDIVLTENRTQPIAPSLLDPNRRHAAETGK